MGIQYSISAEASCEYNGGLLYGVSHCRVVGVSDHCDWPPEAAQLPKVSRSRVDCRSMSPAEVEAQMQLCKQQVLLYSASALNLLQCLAWRGPHRSVVASSRRGSGSDQPPGVKCGPDVSLLHFLFVTFFQPIFQMVSRASVPSSWTSRRWRRWRRGWCSHRTRARRATRTPAS